MQNEKSTNKDKIREKQKKTRAKEREKLAPRGFAWSHRSALVV